MDGRSKWIDASKGVGIILVVIGHAIRGVHKVGLMSDETFLAWDYRIYAFHMPLFFIVSGVFFLGSLRKATVPAFVRGRLVRLLYPLILWTYVFIVFKLMAGAAVNDPVTFDALTSSPLPARWHLWFLWALLLMHLAMVAVIPLLSRLRDIQIAVAVAAIGFVVLFAQLPVQLAPWLEDVTANFVYFGIGLVLGVMRSRISVPSFAFAPILVLMIGIVYLTPQLRGTILSDFAVAVILSSLVLMAMNSVETVGWITRPLAYVGLASMGIYLSHTIFSAAMRIGLIAIDIRDPVLHSVLGSIVGVVCPLIIYLVARPLRLTRLIGF